MTGGTMRLARGSFRLRARVGAIVAGIVCLLLVPSVALAANTASFSSMRPASGALSSVSTPTISVTVYDRYGVKGAASYSIVLDGLTYKPSVAYAKNGDLRRFTLTLNVVAPLTAADHRVTVKVKDLKKKSSSLSWSFTVLAVYTPPPGFAGEMPVTIAVTACSTCHAGYEIAHRPEDDCAACHGPGMPAGDAPHTADEKSPHTLSCVVGYCHGGGGLFPHAVGSYCTYCHSPQFPSAPALHGAASESAHLSTSTFCTQDGCHFASLTVEHYRYSVASGHLTCATCHASTDPAVHDAMAAGSTACTDCHDSDAADHSGAALDHAKPTTSCTGIGCHDDADVVAIHNGACLDCHGPGKTATTDCTGGCHTVAVTSIETHPHYADGHVTAAAGCTATGCHSTSVITIHTSGAKAPGCPACHAAGKPALTVDCATVGCHTASQAAHTSHPVKVADQVITIGGTSFGSHACTECHTSVDLIGLHGGACTTCHPGAATTATFAGGCAQTGCHAVRTPQAIHAAIDTAHVLGAAPPCADCHVGGANVAAIHGVKGGPGCPACHKPGATPTTACATVGCHSTYDTHPYKNPHPTMPAGHTTGLPVTCIVSGCHVSDLATLHTKAPKGCASCHVPGKALTKDCATVGCHPGAVSSGAVHPRYATGHVTTAIGCAGAACHSTNVITIHTTGATKPGCPACHAPGKPALTLVCATTGCHPTLAPEHSAHPTAPAAEVITISGTANGKHACSECHASTELLQVHGNACASCHPTLAAAASFGAGCVQTGCHASGALAKHGGIVTAHAFATTPSCIGSDCHSGANVAALHVSQGCDTCHVPGTTATKVCATAGCHGTADSHPAANPHPKRDSGHTTGLPATCVKAGCHASDLVALHAGAGRCGTCHGTGNALTKDCATVGCHPDPVDSDQLHPTYGRGHVSTKTACAGGGCHVANVITLHTAAGGPGCAACHATGRPALTLDCATKGCHPTITSTATHTGYGTSHALSAPASCAGADCHGTASTVIAIHAGSGCATCHADGKPALTLTCATPTCHGTGDAHPAAAPHPKMNASHTTGLSAGCLGASCHVADLVALHAAAKGCATCHGTGKTPSANCTASGCHPSNGSPKHEAHPSTVTTATFKINNLGYGTYSCSLCHESTDLIAIHGGKTSCAKCHPTLVGNLKPWNGGCDQVGCHDPASPHPMHANLDAKHQTAVKPGCTIDGCHQGNSSVGGKDVILVHYTVGKCTICHGAGKKPSINCINCHANAATGDHQADHQACNDCHAPFVWDQATSTANKGANLGNGAVGGVHWPLQDNVWTVLIGRAVIRQGYPKGDYTQLVFPGVLGTPGTYTSLPYPAGNVGTYTCATCHTGAGKTWVHPGSSYFTCGSSGDCHYHHGNWDPIENTDSYVHNTPPASWTQVMKW